MIKTQYKIFVLLLLVQCSFCEYQRLGSWFTEDSPNITQWFITINNGGPYTQPCGSLNWVGGPEMNQNFRVDKSFTNLVEHTTVQLKFRALLIDAVVGTKLNVLFNNRIVYQVIQDEKQRNSQWQCGDSELKETNYFVDVNIPHRDANLDIRFQMDGESLSIKWALRDVIIDIEACTSKDCKLIAMDAVGNSFTQQQLIDAKWSNFQAPEDLGKFITIQKEQVLGQFGNSNFIKVISDLPSHKWLRIFIKIYKIDSWDQGDGVYINIDGRPIRSVGGDKIENNQNFVAGAWNDGVYQVYIDIPHNNKLLQFSLSGKMNQALSDESWGWKDFVVYAVDCVAPECNVITQDFFTSPTIPIKDDLQGWDITNPDNVISGACNTYNFIRTLNSFLSKTIYNIPKHTQIKASLNFMQLDSIDDIDYVDFRFDNQLIYRQNKMDPANEFPADYLCGLGRALDSYKNLNIIADHTSASLKFDIKSVVDQDFGDESFGFRDLLIVAIDNTPTTQTFFAQDFKEGSYWSNWNGWYMYQLQTYMSRKNEPCGRDFIARFQVETRGSLTKTFTDLPAHKLVTLNFKIYYLDSINTDNKVFVRINENIEFTNIYGPSQTKCDADPKNVLYGRDKFCGNKKECLDEISQHSLTFANNKDYLTVQFFFVELIEDSVGISDIQLLIN